MTGAVLGAVLLVAALAAWHWWPVEAAPGLTAQMVKDIDHPGMSLTLIDGGSRRDAHALWVRYHDRDPHGEPPESPRLQGISLARVRSQGAPGDGTFWVVYSDRVWNQSFGPDGSGGDFAREVIFVDPDSLRPVSSTLF